MQRQSNCFQGALAQCFLSKARQFYSVDSAVYVTRQSPINASLFNSLCKSADFILKSSISILFITFKWFHSNSLNHISMKIQYDLFISCYNVDIRWSTFRNSNYAKTFSEILDDIRAHIFGLFVCYATILVRIRGKKRSNKQAKESLQWCSQLALQSARMREKDPKKLGILLYCPQKLLWNCSESDQRLKMLWNCTGTALELLWKWSKTETALKLH